MTFETPATRLRVQAATLAYDGRTVAENLDFDVPTGEFTIIIGPNGCGKSTLLKSLARALSPREGRVTLDGRDISSIRSKEVARTVALLPQAPIAPDTITVRDLVARGRFPHTTLLRQWSTADEEALTAALERCEIAELAGRKVSELSGGQRQRVWIALVLAQQADIVLLDEPTTFLDIAYQYDVLEMCSALHSEGATLVAVLHDLQQAARYATNLVVMKAGEIVAQGAPVDVLTAELVESVFDLPCRVIVDPDSGTPLVLPRVGARRASAAASAANADASAASFPAAGGSDVADVPHASGLVDASGPADASGAPNACEANRPANCVSSSFPGRSR